MDILSIESGSIFGGFYKYSAHDMLENASVLIISDFLTDTLIDIPNISPSFSNDILSYWNYI